MSTPVTQHTNKLDRNRVKPHVPFCGLLYGAFRHAETIQSQVIGWLIKENLGKKGEGSGLVEILSGNLRKTRKISR
jgi:hypothetical protein